MSGTLAEIIGESPELDHHLIFVLTYEAASSLALDEPDQAVLVVNQIAKRLAEMDPVFSLDRSFAGSVRSSREATDLPHRELILALFAAAGAGTRDGMIAGFGKVAEDLAKVVAAREDVAEEPGG